MNHDMSRSAIECGPIGPRAGTWEDDQPGDKCSACGGYGFDEDPRTGREYDCPICDATGVAL